jgi:hypothetical protein
MSTGSSTLYVTGLNNLYSTNTATGAATLIGFPNVGYIDVVTEDGVIYAVSEDLKIYTLDGSTGAATFLANVSGTNSFFWGLAPDVVTPLPAALPLFATGLGGLGLLGWLRKAEGGAGLIETGVVQTNKAPGNVPGLLFRVSRSN